MPDAHFVFIRNISSSLGNAKEAQWIVKNWAFDACSLRGSAEHQLQLTVIRNSGSFANLRITIPTATPVLTLLFQCLPTYPFNYHEIDPLDVVLPYLGKHEFGNRLAER